MDSQRYISIDLMRALAIAGMVLCHFVTFWSMEEKNPLVFFIGDSIIGDWPAPFFAFLVGVSAALSIKRRKEKGHSPAFICKQGVKRGLFIFVLGLVLMACTLGPASIFAWSILTLLGTGMVLIHCLRDVPSVSITFMCAGVILVTPFLQEAYGFLNYWGGEVKPDFPIIPLIPNLFYCAFADYSPGFGLDAVNGFFVSGYFPAFPWIVFPLMGYVTGRALFMDDRSVNKGGKTLPYLGIFLIIMGIAAGLAGSFRVSPRLVGEIITPFSFYPETIPMLLVQLGLAVTVLERFHKLLDGRDIPVFWVINAGRLSRYSLTLYIIHLLLIFVPVNILAFLYPGSIPVMKTISPATGIGIGILFLVAFLLWTRRWDRSYGKYSFEWIMTKIIGS